MRLTRDTLSRALPELAGTVRPPRLGAAADVWRDAEGIPHIMAASAHDAFFAQGFVHAQDRLWHMEYDRRRAQGRWAEYAGAAAVAQDIHLRRLRLGATARADYEAVNEETRAMLDAYADGVNGFLATTRTLPIEFRLLEARPEPWAPWDSLAVFKMRHVEMGPLAVEAVARAAPPPRRSGARVDAVPGVQTPPNPTLIVPPGAPCTAARRPTACDVRAGAAALLAEVADLGGGSNNWALAGGPHGIGEAARRRGSPPGVSTCRTCTTRTTSRVPSSTRSGCPFPGRPACRTSATTGSSRGA